MLFSLASLNSSYVESSLEIAGPATISSGALPVYTCWVQYFEIGDSFTPDGVPLMVPAA